VYAIAITAHSLVRWAILVLGILAVASALAGWSRRRAIPFVVALDLQLILGLVLWLFLSPLTTGLGREALRDREVRQMALEHPLLAIAAVVMAHVGSVLWKRGKQRLAAALLAAALVTTAAAVPWSRPLLRL